MRRLTLQLAAVALLIASPALADIVDFRGSTAVVSDEIGPLGFMFNVDQFTVNGVVYTPQTPGTVASIYVFDSGSIQGWGDATYVAGASTFTFAGLTGVNPCYDTEATYGGAGDPNCLVGPLPFDNTGWMYGETIAYPVLPADEFAVPYAPTSYRFTSSASILYLDSFATTFGVNTPTDMMLVLNFDEGGLAESSLTSVPEPRTVLLLGIQLACFAFVRRRARNRRG